MSGKFKLFYTFNFSFHTCCLFFFVLIGLQSFSVCAQSDKKTIVLEAVIIGRDTLPVVNLAVFHLEAKMDPEALKSLQKFYRLRNNVLKVLPYARLAGVKLKEINDYKASLSNESQRKAYTKAEEKKLKKQFEGELKNLTISQGQILIKLIDRETGHTSYDLVKELRGSLQAFFWQGLARVFGSNLKTEYDSLNTDKAIEAIIRSADQDEKTKVKTK